MHTLLGKAGKLLVLILCLYPLVRAGAAAPAAGQTSAPIRLQFAVYYLPRPATDPALALRQILARRKDAPALVERLPEHPDRPVLHAYLMDNVRDRYAPPGIESLRYSGRGLDDDQAQALQDSAQAYILDFAHPGARTLEGLRAANGIAEALARETGALVWDEQTREVFTPDAWRSRRIDAWREDPPDVSDHITIHAYKSGDYVRAITLGMAKFGLPDVVVNDFSWSLSRGVGSLINLYCQAMVEGAADARPGRFDLDLHAIRNAKLRDTELAALLPNATASALLSLKPGEREEGDPANRLLEISFDRYPGRDVHARQERLLSDLFGWEDAITQANHDEALLAASGRARERLPALREAFAAGLRPGELIQVKAPFDTPDGGREWMWVEITAWRGNVITGLLKNEPFNIPSLHGGQVVEIDQRDVFDYIRRFPDGREEGNETGRLIRQQSGDDR